MRLAPPVPLTACERNTIELALAKPRAAFGGVEQYPSLADKAAALLYGLSKSQACADGNKRVALILVIEFLRINNARLRTKPGELAVMILGVGESIQSSHDDVVLGLAEWMDRRIERGTT